MLETLNINKVKVKVAVIERSFLLMIITSATRLFSSTELKAQVTFPDQKIVCRRYHWWWRHGVVVFVKFSHFRLLLQNHRANFKQTRHKPSLGKRDSSFWQIRNILFWQRTILWSNHSFAIKRVYWLELFLGLTIKLMGLLFVLF